MATSFPWHCHQSSHLAEDVVSIGGFKTMTHNAWDILILRILMCCWYSLCNIQGRPVTYAIDDSADIAQWWNEKKNIMRVLKCFNKTLFVTNMRFHMWNMYVLKHLYINWLDLTETTIFWNASAQRIVSTPLHYCRWYVFNIDTLLLFYQVALQYYISSNKILIKLYSPVRCKTISVVSVVTGSYIHWTLITHDLE